LVPGCTFSVLIKAFISGELKELFNYDESSKRGVIEDEDKPLLNKSD